MKVSAESEHKYGSKIQIAKASDGGNASWGTATNPKDSIRLAWYKPDNKFDPFSSSELAMWALKDLVETAARQDLFSRDELAEMLGTLTTAIYKKI